MTTVADWIIEGEPEVKIEVGDSDLTRALKQIRNDSRRYRICAQYYRGKHQLPFATEKFKNAFGDLFRAFSDNLCPAVCDAVSDNLQVTGFGVEKGPAKLGKEAAEIWESNRMDQRAGEVHLEAVRAGDAFVIVWPGADGRPVIYPQPASNCTIYYDCEQPGTVLWAAKFWRGADMKVRANLYYPDKIEKYVTPNQHPNGLPDRDANFVKFAATFKGKAEPWPLPNEFGVVPLFHFPNNASVGQMGNSDLVPVIPLQDALNKAVLDMMVAMEFAAFRQRWATGIELSIGPDGKPQSPFVPGIERLWTAESEQAKFGQFEATDLEEFLKVQNDFRLEIARVSATPLHYLMLQQGSVTSGEALKALEKRHVKKVKDRMTTFGNVWEDVMAFALQISTGRSNLRLSTDWADPFGPTDKEKLDAAMVKQSLGVSEEQNLKEIGYGDEEIKLMQQQNASKRTANQRDFNAL